MAIPSSEFIQFLIRYAEKKDTPNLQIKVPQSDPNADFEISITALSPFAALNKTITISRPEENVDNIWILSQQISRLQEKITELDSLKLPVIAQYHSPGMTITTGNWTDVTNLSICKFISMGYVKVTIEFSAYGTQHGGIRLILDKALSTETIFGTNQQYGLDWVLAGSNVWVKRTLVRVFPVQSGPRIFTVQIRAQNEGNSFQIHGGDEKQYFSGMWLLLENVQLLT